MHRALVLDGASHGATAEDWFPAIYEIAGGLLESASVNREPPSLVDEATAAVRWLSQAIVDADHDAPDTPAAIVDGLGRILTLALFATLARRALREVNP
jgi:hypothetical protein